MLSAAGLGGDPRMAFLSGDRSPGFVGNEECRVRSLHELSKGSANSDF